MEVALRLFPATRHVFIVGGTSDFDRTVMSLTKNSMSSFAANADIVYSKNYRTYLRTRLSFMSPFFRIPPATVSSMRPRPSPWLRRP
jgi:hypothetical protein